MNKNKKETIVNLPGHFYLLSEAGKEKAIARRVARKERADKRRHIFTVCCCILCVLIGFVAAPQASELPPAEPADPVIETLYVYGYSRPAWDIDADEQLLVARVVSGMAANQPALAKQAVAQAIRDASERYNMSVVQTIEWGKYPIDAGVIAPECTSAVDRMVEGHDAIDSELLFAYNPAVQDGAWHETKEFVIELGELRFFK